MIERVRIADIMTPADEVIFYDPAMEEKLRQFCKERAISYLPSSEESDTRCFQYQRNKNSFHLIPIGDLKIDTDVDVFSGQALVQFEDHKVLFVYHHGEFCGVVHFSDYNKDVINIYLYTLISKYEKSIRELLRKSSLENSDMGKFFELNKFNGRINNYNKPSKRKILASKPHFDQFYIDDLIGLLNHKIEDINLDLDVKELRNSIMHSNETINKDQEGGGLIFDINQFSTFFRRVTSLKKDTRKVRTRLQLLSLEK
ncbi:hypothetical protein ACP8Y2_21150 [Herpetosiphon llansteffanensis]